MVLDSESRAWPSSTQAQPSCPGGSPTPHLLTHIHPLPRCARRTTLPPPTVCTLAQPAQCPPRLSCESATYVQPRLLSSGGDDGSGAYYVLTDEQSGATATAKVSWQGLQQLQQELAVLQQLQHAYILQLRGWGQQQEVAYMLHEPTTAVTVQDVVTCRGRLSEHQAASVLQQALDALAHLHARGISGCSGLGLHSLLLTASCDVKLFGFAAAAAGGDGGGGGPLVGRPRTPDDDGVAAGARAAGRMLHAMLVGQPSADASSLHAPGLSGEAASLLQQLSRATATTSLEVLRQHPFFQQPQQPAVSSRWLSAAELAEVCSWKDAQLALPQEQQQQELQLQNHQQTQRQPSGAGSVLDFALPASGPADGPMRLGSHTSCSSSDAHSLTSADGSFCSLPPVLPASFSGWGSCSNVAMNLQGLRQLQQQQQLTPQQQPRQRPFLSLSDSPASAESAHAFVVRCRLGGGVRCKSTTDAHLQQLPPRSHRSRSFSGGLAGCQQLLVGLTGSPMQAAAPGGAAPSADQCSTPMMQHQHYQAPWAEGTPSPASTRELVPAVAGVVSGPGAHPAAAAAAGGDELPHRRSPTPPAIDAALLASCVSPRATLLMKQLGTSGSGGGGASGRGAWHVLTPEHSASSLASSGRRTPSPPPHGSTAGTSSCSGAAGALPLLGSSDLGTRQQQHEAGSSGRAVKPRPVARDITKSLQQQHHHQQQQEHTDSTAWPAWKAQLQTGGNAVQPPQQQAGTPADSSDAAQGCDQHRPEWGAAAATGHSVRGSSSISMSPAPPRVPPSPQQQHAAELRVRRSCGSIPSYSACPSPMAQGSLLSMGHAASPRGVWQPAPLGSQAAAGTGGLPLPAAICAALGSTALSTALPQHDSMTLPRVSGHLGSPRAQGWMSPGPERQQQGADKVRSAAQLSCGGAPPAFSSPPRLRRGDAAAARDSNPASGSGLFLQGQEQQHQEQQAWLVGQLNLKALALGATGQAHTPKAAAALPSALPPPHPCAPPHQHAHTGSDTVPATPRDQLPGPGVGHTSSAQGAADSQQQQQHPVPPRQLAPSCRSPCVNVRLHPGAASPVAAGTLAGAFAHQRQHVPRSSLGSIDEAGGNAGRAARPGQLSPGLGSSGARASPGPMQGSLLDSKSSSVSLGLYSSKSSSSGGAHSISTPALLMPLPLPAFDQPHLSTAILQHQVQQEEAEGKAPIVPPLGMRCPSPPPQHSAGRQPLLLRSPRRPLPFGAPSPSPAGDAASRAPQPPRTAMAHSPRVLVPHSPSPPPFAPASASSPRVGQIGVLMQPCPPALPPAAPSPSVKSRSLHVNTGALAGPPAARLTAALGGSVTPTFLHSAYYGAAPAAAGQLGGSRPGSPALAPRPVRRAASYGHSLADAAAGAAAPAAPLPPAPAPVAVPAWPWPAVVAFAHVKGRLGYWMASGVVGVLFDDGSHMLKRVDEPTGRYLAASSDAEPAAGITSANSRSATSMDVAGISSSARDQLTGAGEVFTLPLPSPAAHRADGSSSSSQSKLPEHLSAKARCLQRFENCLVHQGPYSSKCQPDVTRLVLPAAEAAVAAAAAATPAAANQQQLKAHGTADVVHLRSFVWRQVCLCLQLTDGTQQLVFTRDSSVLLVEPGRQAVAHITPPSRRPRASRPAVASEEESDSSGGDDASSDDGSSSDATGAAAATQLQLVRLNAAAAAPADRRLLASVVYASHLQALRLPHAWQAAAAAAGMGPGGDEQ